MRHRVPLLNTGRNNRPAVTGTAITTPFSIQGKPALTGAADSTFVYVENDSLLLVGRGISLADPDDNIDSLIISTTGFIAGEDSLRILVPASASLSLTDSAGFYIFTGTATVADFQQIIDSLGYVNLSDSLAAATRTIRISLNDATNFSTDTLTRNISLLPVNDAPTGRQVEDFVVLRQNEIPTGTSADIQNFSLAELQAFAFADLDTTQRQGVLITSAAAAGTWQYSLDNGTSWNAIDFNTSALRLFTDENATDKRLRLLPRADVNGTYTNGLTFRLWDGSDLGAVTTEAPDGIAEGEAILPADFAENLSDSSAYSTGSFSAIVEIEAVNGAPTFTLNRTVVQVNEDAGLVTLPSIFSTFDDGDPELNQSLMVDFTQVSATPFATLQQGLQLDVFGANQLTFAADSNAVGTILFNVQLRDNGSGIAPNINQSQLQQIEVQILPVNDAPAFAFATDTLFLQQDFEALDVPLAIAPVPADEQQQQVQYTLLND